MLLGAHRVEIPAASAGMTEVASVGMTEVASAGMTVLSRAGVAEVASAGVAGGGWQIWGCDSYQASMGCFFFVRGGGFGVRRSSAIRRSRVSSGAITSSNS